MQKYLACYKWVVDESSIRINGDLSVDTSRSRGKISEYDKNAIELVGQLARKAGGEAIGLTFGDEVARKSLKDSLSRGLDRVYWVKATDAGRADGAVTARALAAAVKSEGEGIALVVCAEGSSDNYARQTAPRLAALLGWPAVTSACELTVTEGVATVVRRLEDHLETVSVKLPAVVSVLPDINQPAIPGLKAVMSAGKKPVTETTVGELGVDVTPTVELTGLTGYAQERKKVVIEGEDMAAKVTQLVIYLRREGVI